MRAQPRFDPSAMEPPPPPISGVQRRGRSRIAFLKAFLVGLGGSAYWAWIHAGTESAPAPAPPQEEEDEGPARYIPIKAYFLSTSIDLKSMQAEHGNDIVPPPTCSFNYIALRYSEFPPEIIFQYGSVVLFSIADHEAEYYLDIIRKHASGWLPETRKDDYAVVEKPSLTTWMKGGLDYIVLKSLDTDGICIISSVLGQSIALDHYIRQELVYTTFFIGTQIYQALSPYYMVKFFKKTALTVLKHKEMYLRPITGEESGCVSPIESEEVPENSRTEEAITEEGNPYLTTEHEVQGRRRYRRSPNPCARLGCRHCGSPQLGKVWPTQRAEKAACGAHG
ncbi:unnamed protein product [Miscanthus lutarioriparius]|uniref:DUF155 domain-containing protein n=1 Tax=Miscanthus lutarioriparius TaxID=422564 RepID=A0A811M8V3_9POAL|nr:unnamed protein product [Miscanthus lutarioriparius]